MVYTVGSTLCSFFLNIAERSSWSLKNKTVVVFARENEAFSCNSSTYQACLLTMQALPSPSQAESVVLLGKQAWLLLFLACLCLSLPFFFFLCLGFSLTPHSFSLSELCKSFTVAVLRIQSLRITKWHLKPSEIQPSLLPPPLSSKWNGTKWRAPILLFPSGTVEPHFRV